MIGNNLWCLIPESRAACVCKATQAAESHGGLGSGRARTRSVAAHRLWPAVRLSSFCQREPATRAGTSRSRVDSLPNLWSILMLNQCRSHIKIKFYIGSDAPAGHTRNCCRSVAEIMAPSKMRSINLAYRPGYDCMRRSRVRVIKLTGHRGDRDIRIALSSEAPLKGFARGYI
jgi:hypothetical protein